ncbi:DUF2795 domain-containing protein, partial [Streptomyces durbertensis]
MERRSDKLSPRQDEEMKHELRGRLRADHPTRVEEWRDPEPLAEDDPALAAGPVGRPGAPGEDPLEELRLDLARHLGRHGFPADRGELEDDLAAHHAPDRLIEAVRRLPADRSFVDVQDVVT